MTIFVAAPQSDSGQLELVTTSNNRPSCSPRDGFTISKSLASYSVQVLLFMSV